MELTERQCWDVIRKMVGDKYKDHAGFVTMVIDEDYDKLTGNIKRVYLNKFGFETEADFKYLIKNRGVQTKRDWMDNLSSEDLLIFLDYFCRSLQDMYQYYGKNKRNLEHVPDSKKMFESDTKKILETTGRHPAFKYNTKRLKATGRPEAVADEKKVSALGLTEKDLQRQALVQVIGDIAYKYSRFTLVDIKTSVEKVITLKTHTINSKGYVEGFINNLKPQDVLAYLDEKYGLNKINDEINELNRPHASEIKVEDDSSSKLERVGYDSSKMPIYKQGENYVDLIGRPVSPEMIVYDRDKNKIEDDLFGL